MLFPACCLNPQQDSAPRAPRIFGHGKATTLQTIAPPFSFPIFGDIGKIYDISCSHKLFRINGSPPSEILPALLERDFYPFTSRASGYNEERARIDDSILLAVVQVAGESPLRHESPSRSPSRRFMFHPSPGPDESSEVMSHWLPLAVCLISFGAVKVADAQTPASSTESLPEGVERRLTTLPLTNRDGGVYRVRYSPDGKLLAVRTHDQVVRVYQIPSGELLHQLDGHVGVGVEMDFSPDSRKIVTGTDYESDAVQLWDVQTGESIQRVDVRAECLRWWSTDQILIGKSPMIVSVDARSGGVTGHNRFDLPPGAALLEISDTGRWAFSYTPSRDESAVWHSLRTGNIISVLQGLPRPKTVAFSERHGLMAVAAWPQNTILPRFPIGTGLNRDELSDKDTQLSDHEIGIWPSDGRGELARLRGHRNTIESLGFSPDGRWLASTGRDGRLWIWELLTMKPVTWTQLADEDGVGTAVAFAPLRWQMVTGSSGGNVNQTLLWDLKFLLFNSQAAGGLDTDRDDDVQSEANSQDLEALWTALASEDPQIAYHAIDAVMSDPSRRDALDPFMAQLVDPVTTQRLQQWIDQLDSPSFSTRDAAYESLLKHRASAIALIENALQQFPSLEKRKRLRRLLSVDEGESITDTDLRRAVRFILLLEMRGDQAALELLRQLSEGSTSRTVIEESRAALTRCNQRAQLGLP